jgi:hypothetical protein
MQLNLKTKAKIELYKRQIFDHEALGLSPKQIEALKELHPMNKECRVLTYGGGAFGGKSWLIAYWETLNSLAYAGIKQYIARNELKRLMSSTYVTFMQVAQSLDLIPNVHWKLNGQYNYIEFFNGSRIDLLDVSYQPRDPLYERFGSTEYTAGANEEAGEIDFGAFDILYTRTGRFKNDVYDFYPKNLNTANPKKNWLYTYFYKPWRDDSLDEGYSFIQSLPTDNPFGDPNYIESLRKTKDKVKRERLLFGNWEYDDDPSKLIEYDKILDLWTNDFVEGGRRYITADIATKGSDKFVICVWDGLKVIEIYSIAKNTGKEAVDKIQECAKKHGVPNSNIVYDADGVGGGLTGFIANVHEFNNGAKAKNGENYANLKSQCYFKLAEYINEGKIYIVHDEHKELIVEELEQVKRDKVDQDGKLTLMKKQEVKDRIGRSPDFTDALAERMFFELSSGVQGFNANFF